MDTQHKEVNFDIKHKMQGVEKRSDCYATEVKLS